MFSFDGMLQKFCCRCLTKPFLSFGQVDWGSSPHCLFTTVCCHYVPSTRALCCLWLCISFYLLCLLWKIVRSPPGQALHPASPVSAISHEHIALEAASLHVATGHLACWRLERALISAVYSQTLFPSSLLSLIQLRYLQAWDGARRQAALN